MGSRPATHVELPCAIRYCWIRANHHDKASYIKKYRPRCTTVRTNSIGLWSFVLTHLVLSATLEPQKIRQEV